MPDAQMPDYPRIPLTRFHNNTGEFLDLAIRSPVSLTSHGRERHFIVEADYFRRLEMIAAGRIAEAMNLRAIRVEDLSDKHRDMIAGAMPTQEEIDNDRWTEHAA